MTRIARGFRDTQRGQVASLFWGAFSGKLGRLLGPEVKAQAFLRDVVEPRFALSASQGDVLLGVAGIKTQDGGLVGGGLSDLARVYGWVGAIWRGLLLEQLDRKLAAGQLLMDGIFVAEQARGQGIGSALLRAVLDHARESGYREVRLDVIDSNTRARALYERHGFEPRETVSTGPLRHVFGFRAATMMVRKL